MNKFITGLMVIIAIALASLWFIRRAPQAAISHERDYIIVGTNAEYPPFATIENDTVVGFDIDLINAIAQHINKKIVLKDMPFDALISEIQLGHIDVIAAGMTATPERERQLFFSDTYIQGDPLVAITLDPTITTIERVDDLKGKQIVVNEGYTADDYLSTFDNLEINRLATPAEAILALTSKRADIFVAALSSIKPFLSKEKNKKFVYFPLQDTADSYSIAIAKTSPELRTAINDALQGLKASGVLEQLKQKWNIS